jgi:molecular chaperone GrpE
MTEENKNEQEIKYEDEDDGGDSGDLAEKIKKLKERLKQCQKERQEYLIGWQRCQADFINYKRRQEEQMAEWSKLFGGGLIRDLLPVLDGLEPRNYAEQDAEQRGKEMVSGIKMIKEQLFSVLKKHGLEEIKAIGEKFNPEWHEAIEQVKTEDGEENIIAEEIQKGYMLSGKVLRVAKVKVTK